MRVVFLFIGVMILYFTLPMLWMVAEWIVTDALPLPVAVFYGLAPLLFALSAYYLIRLTR